MSNLKPSEAMGTDWTRLLADPDLVRHVGKLLQTYREASPETREQTLLKTMREIKAQAASDRKSTPATGVDTLEESHPVPTPASASPPFEPDVFRPNSADDRRRHPRIKCFVAVEMRVDEASTPVWGNLANTSVGGCLVETASPIRAGAKVEIGLWVANGKIWVKGFALSGVVTRSASAGVRVRFGNLEANERESLRQFLKYATDATQASRSESTYLQMLK
ncbi:MAG TPA: PilZ domain-containing protein [Candidatus Sulfotelmatobacter sp.]|nr:PilZ domain-containing protein [Candidatus Sulfotelmatobacter sp.]